MKRQNMVTKWSGPCLIHYQGLVNLLALKLSEASSAMQGYFHFQEIWDNGLDGWSWSTCGHVSFVWCETRQREKHQTCKKRYKTVSRSWIEKCWRTRRWNRFEMGRMRGDRIDVRNADASFFPIKHVWNWVVPTIRFLYLSRLKVKRCPHFLFPCVAGLSKWIELSKK